MRLNKRKVLLGAFFLTPIMAGIQTASAQPLDMGTGTIDPLTIPKYVTPLVIPPVMQNEGAGVGYGGVATTEYDIAVRQFQQQILPGGIWNTINGRADAFPATTVWSYGPANNPLPDSTALGGGVGIAPAPNSQFNYPSYTIENIKDNVTRIQWKNELTDNAWALDRNNPGNSLPHLLPVDQSLHWANPTQECDQGGNRTNCYGISAAQYDGPVPMITHVHGAHVAAASDGYTEAWWLPKADNINCVPEGQAGGLGATTPGVWDVACEGNIANKLTRVDGSIANNTNSIDQGIARFGYHNDQPSTTIWYHDHALGMTRLNVYAGPAGFWLIRDPAGKDQETGLVSTFNLPGPAPVAGEDLATTNLPASLGGARNKYREIPIVIQDRAFKTDGSLFYPDNRAFFEGLNVAGTAGTPAEQFAGAPELQIDLDPLTSDIAPIWNPEAFFNTMVVNGSTWPQLEVAPAMYRFRLLNGCNSRFLNLALKITDAAGNPVTVNKTYYKTLKRGKKVVHKAYKSKVGELDFFQIGAEQSLKPTVTAIRTGFATNLTAATQYKPNGDIVNPVQQDTPDNALLLALAERADVLVDFRGLPNGTIITMTNTAPDAPFGGFPDVAADPSTTGQVMRFVVNNAHLGLSPTDELRDPVSHAVTNAATAASDVTAYGVNAATPGLDSYTVKPVAGVRELALIEEESSLICVDVDLAGNVFQTPDAPVAGACPAPAVPMAPKAAVLGTIDAAGAQTVTLWADHIATNVTSGTSEQWNINNLTVDGHPIHVHLVKYKVVGRTAIGGGPSLFVTAPNGVEPWEDGWKDTVLTYPGDVTSIQADFDIDGLYVWHCHIVEHEDNEMMVPLCVGTVGVDCPGVLI